MSDEQLVQMEIREIQIAEDLREIPVVILVEVGGFRHFPIFMGHFEANALEDSAFTADGKTVSPHSRPLTHDFIVNILNDLEASPIRVVIPRLENDTYYGELEIKSSAGSIVRVDCRPSDAMVLATKLQIPIYVEENVLAQVASDLPENPPE